MAEGPLLITTLVVVVCSVAFLLARRKQKIEPVNCSETCKLLARRLDPEGVFGDQAKKLEASARNLKNAKCVAILAGCVVVEDSSEVKSSVDGAPGAIAIARAILNLSDASSVVIVIDDTDADVFMSAVAGCGILGTRMRLEALAAANEWGPEDEDRVKDIVAEADHVVAVGRRGVDQRPPLDQLPGGPEEGKAFWRKVRDTLSPIERIPRNAKCEVVALGHDRTLAQSMLPDEVQSRGTTILAGTSNAAAFALAAVVTLLKSAPDLDGLRLHEARSQAW